MADHVGVYDIYGAVMASPGARGFNRVTRLVDDWKMSGAFSSSFPDYGSVLPVLEAKYHEVTRTNAFLSGTERFESGSNIIFAYSGSEYPVFLQDSSSSYTFYSWAERNSFYSKSVLRQYTSPAWAATNYDYLKKINIRAIDGDTSGITDNTSSNPDSFAVLTFLTGNIANILWKEYGISSPSWYLDGNGFNTPYIPDSSMSLGTGSAAQIDAAANAEILMISTGLMPPIPGQNDMQSYLARQQYSTNAAAAAEAALQPVTSSTYFPLP